MSRMNRFALVLAASLALAGCGKKGGDADVAANTDTATQNAAVTAPAPTGKDWTQVVAPTDAGSFQMGNPDAKVHLVEYASLTCPHCAHFAQEDFPKLREKYIKPGLVSYELRNLVRDGADFSAVLLARCGGASAFFPLSEQIWAEQPVWEDKLTKMSSADQARLKTVPREKLPAALAAFTGLDTFVEQHGIPAAKVQACLSDQAAIAPIEKMQQEATADGINGTPMFLIGGKLVPDAYTWEALEPALKAAIAG